MLLNYSHALAKDLSLPVLLNLFRRHILLLHLVESLVELDLIVLSSLSFFDRAL